jgi:hypothetical protein
VGGRVKRAYIVKFLNFSACWPTDFINRFAKKTSICSRIGVFELIFGLNLQVGLDMLHQRYI